MRDEPSLTNQTGTARAPAARELRARLSFFKLSRRTLYVLQVRLRFVVVLILGFLVIGNWDTIRNYWDRLTHFGVVEQEAISLDTEYFCPMCPGVVSHWPSKCPVCHMTLVRRKKGEAALLPEGVLARMQFSPYRLQLAGIRTTPVEFRRLECEIVTVGVVEASAAGSDTGHASVQAEVFEPDLPFLSGGQAAELTSPAFPGRAPFIGRVVLPREIELSPTRSLRLRVETTNPTRELRPGMAPTVRIKSSVPQLAWFQTSLVDQWRDHTLADLLGHAIDNPVGLMPEAGLGALVRNMTALALARQGWALAIPDTALLDTGQHQIVYVESGPGMFDAVEVALGPRCGEYYPVFRGVALGQRVATAGAFLIDAETRLNPNVAAAYFGAGRGGASAGTITKPEAGALSIDDQRLAARQKTCPVTGEALDAMGGPYKVVLSGKTIFLCCQGCEQELRKHPDKYLEKVPK